MVKLSERKQKYYNCGEMASFFIRGNVSFYEPSFGLQANFANTRKFIIITRFDDNDMTLSFPYRKSVFKGIRFEPDDAVLKRKTQQMCFNNCQNSMPSTRRKTRLHVCVYGNATLKGRNIRTAKRKSVLLYHSRDLMITPCLFTKLFFKNVTAFINFPSIGKY